MSSNTIVQNVKKYVSGSHRFINVGTGSTSVPTDTLVTLAKSTIMTIENGNVGVGTTNPLYKLHLNGNAYLNGTVTTNNNNIDAGTGTITANSLAGGVVTDSTSTTSSSIAASATAVKSAYELAAAALPKTGGTVNGDVVILANLTASNLTVIGDTTVLNTVSSNTEQMVITNAGTGPALKVTQTGNNSVAEFYDNESGIALFVGNNGIVGIGTTNPNYRLVIGENTTRDEVVSIMSQNYAGLEINGDTANTAGEPGGAYIDLVIDGNITHGVLALNQSTGGNGKGGTLTGSFGNSLLLYTTTTIPIQFGTANTIRMILDSTGKLGIGTTAPAYPLDVTGAVEADRYISTVATGTAPLTVSSTTVVTNLNADLLDGQTGTYYTNYNNLTNAPTPSVMNRHVSGFTNAATAVSTVTSYNMATNMTTFFTFDFSWSVSATTPIPYILIANTAGTGTFLAARLMTYTSGTTVYEIAQSGFIAPTNLHNGTPTINSSYQSRLIGWMSNTSGASVTIAIRARSGATTNTLSINYGQLAVYRDVGVLGF